MQPSKHAGLDPSSARSVEPWNGSPREGTLVSFDDGTFGMHVGRESYVALDLQRDLGGNAPVVGQFGSIAHGQGLVQTASQDMQQTQSLGRA